MMQTHTAAEIMLMLKALSPDVRLAYSEYTQKWYVESRHLEVGNGCLLRGGSEHRDTPDDAVQAFFVALTNIGLDEYIVGEYGGERREYRWNGAAFAECTRREVLASRRAEAIP